jgi:hypothetical protein
MIKEKDRRLMLARRKVMRRHQTLLKQSKQDFYVSVKTAWENGATPTELAKFLGLSLTRTKVIIYETEKEGENGRQS